LLVELLQPYWTRKQDGQGYFETGLQVRRVSREQERIAEVVVLYFDILSVVLGLGAKWVLGIAVEWG
jgi:hypothetical protein